MFAVYGGIVLMHKIKMQQERLHSWCSAMRKSFA